MIRDSTCYDDRELDSALWLMLEHARELALLRSLEQWKIQDAAQSTPTHDVDIAITENVGSLIPILLQYSKLILPHARIFTGVLRIYMRTGPAYNHVNCTSDQLVKVELLMEGLRPVQFTEHITTKGFQHHELTSTFHVMDFQCLLRSKLYSFYEREGEQDYQDVLFLINNNQEEISKFINRLDADWRETFLAKGIMK
ncbi:hypothetical protein MMC18_000305 [Xylographa bjoerkii]|nr:hypothetical protein [Xylographa bjoerkii]